LVAVVVVAGASSKDPELDSSLASELSFGLFKPMGMAMLTDPVTGAGDALLAFG
jgi:hypothetical protein